MDQYLKYLEAAHQHNQLSQLVDRKPHQTIHQEIADLYYDLISSKVDNKPEILEPTQERLGMALELHQWHYPPPCMGRGLI